MTALTLPPTMTPAAVCALGLIADARANNNLQGLFKIASRSRMPELLGLIDAELAVARMADRTGDRDSLRVALAHAGATLLLGLERLPQMMPDEPARGAGQRVEISEP